jgi:hypothetical protein
VPDQRQNPSAGPVGNGPQHRVHAVDCKTSLT